MTYLKYILLVIGLIIIMIVRMRYTKRAVHENNQDQPYSASEKFLLYSGYAILALAIISVIIFQ